MSFDIGDRVIDRDDDSPSVAEVVDLPGTTADEHEIPAMNKTVAMVNPDHPADDPVVGIQFIRNGDPAGATYHYPASRLDSDFDEQELEESHSSGWYDRRDIYGEHTTELSLFISRARHLFADPLSTSYDVEYWLDLRPGAERVVENAEEVLTGIYTAGEPTTPRPGPDHDTSVETRGECRYSRNDRYRPNVSDAICCWECSDRSHNRPEKFLANDGAGPVCEGYPTPPWELRQELRDYITIDGHGDPPGDETDALAVASDLGRLREAVENNDDDTTRRKALRLAYRLSLEHVEEYHYGRALAILRDHGATEDLPILGDGSATREDADVTVIEYGTTENGDEDEDDADGEVAA